jgi:hypothetical protein
MRQHRQYHVRNGPDNRLTEAVERRVAADLADGWGTVFGDPVVATAILDRLLHHSHVITIRGDSYRLKEKRRSGLLQKASVAEGKPEKKREH